MKQRHTTKHTEWPAALLAALALAALPASAAKKLIAPPAADASTYPARETHEKEHVTIAAEPFETRAKAEFFRLDYPGHSILPVRVMIKNDGDQALDLNEVRIQFVAGDGTKLPAATPDEINRRLFRFKDLQPKHIPGTPVTYHSTPVDKKIQQDDTDFSFSQTTVPAHSTATGFLFYDVKDVDDPPLRHAELYVKRVHVNDAKRTELFGFTVPFDPYLAAKKAADAAAAESAAKTAAKTAGNDGRPTEDESKGGARKESGKP